MDLEEKKELLDSKVNIERGKLSSDRMDISFGELINLYKSEELIIRPEYQRLFRWSSSQKTALIESILLSIPIPPVFVAENEDGIWELVDGLQRVATFISFFGDLKTDVSKNQNLTVQETTETEVDQEKLLLDELTEEIGNKWVLEAGGLIPELEGFNIETLPTKLRINLKRAVCRVEILRGESSLDMKYELFKRLNSGGSKLTPQEIRNAVFRGINPEINEFIIELSNNLIFKKMTALSSQKLLELYDQELVLRFIAFYNRIDNINNNTEKYLSEFMNNACRQYIDLDLAHLKALFTESLELLDLLGDQRVFRNSNNLFVPAYYEGILIGLAQNIEKYRHNPELLRSKIGELKLDENFKKASGPASNSKNRIRTRLSRAVNIFSNVVN